MEIYSRFNYILEIVIGELAFLVSFPRRRKFPFRIAASLAVSITVGYFMFTIRGGGHVGRFLQLLLALTVTIVSMYFSFQGTWLSIVSACTAGIALQHIGYHLSRILALLPFMNINNVLLELFTCLTLFLAAVLIARVKGAGTRLRDMRSPWILFTSAGIVLLCIGVTRFVRLGGGAPPVITFCISLYAIICCSLILFIQLFLYNYFELRNEKMMLEQVSMQKKRQYEANRETREQLNIRYHDLKHHILALEDRLPSEKIDSIRELVESYDSAYKTGLDALDVVLNEKYDRCRQRNIALTFMGSGDMLRFMDTMDVYSLFGNMLDNAIAAAERLEEVEKRLISIVIEKKGSFTYISAMNYFQGKELVFRDGIPVTTAEHETDYHGFGLKSIRNTAEKYQGGLTISVSNGVFCLNLYLMDPLENR